MEQAQFNKMLDNLLMSFYYIAQEKLSSDDSTLYLTQEQKEVFVKHAEHLARIARESKVSSHAATDLNSPTQKPNIQEEERR